ncbi:MAG: cbb3-type cytochrome oxidase assembly protein CcoS [Candidatus Dadabacteria bacterium]|nr:MAG: cbb3-type cytochrome oxidase assembly protein CcoS [Candidatus Dadabacteria bacterium]
MDIIYLLLPLSLLLALVGLAAFIWATRSGQFDDLDTPQIRMLFDDEEDRAQESSKSGSADKPKLE